MAACVVPLCLDHRPYNDGHNLASIHLSLFFPLSSLPLGSGCTCVFIHTLPLCRHGYYLLLCFLPFNASLVADLRLSQQTDVNLITLFLSSRDFPFYLFINSHDSYSTSVPLAISFTLLSSPLFQTSVFLHGIVALCNASLVLSIMYTSFLYSFSSYTTVRDVDNSTNSLHSAMNIQNI